MKKKLIILIFVICIVLIGFAIIFKNKGNISNVNIVSKESQIYSKDDIDSAIAVTKKYFKENFYKCSLLKIGNMLVMAIKPYFCFLKNRLTNSI